jgi:hypothetical protein|tara:strand:+ start:377 stop:649 length:273 start_codon:yes stop_codon:yes gene_type:complete
VGVGVISFVKPTTTNSHRIPGVDVGVGNGVGEILTLGRQHISGLTKESITFTIIVFCIGNISTPLSPTILNSLIYAPIFEVSFSVNCVSK